MLMCSFHISEVRTATIASDALRFVQRRVYGCFGSETWHGHGVHFTSPSFSGLTVMASRPNAAHCNPGTHFPDSTSLHPPRLLSYPPRYKNQGGTGGAPSGSSGGSVAPADRAQVAQPGRTPAVLLALVEDPVAVPASRNRGDDGARARRERSAAAIVRARCVQRLVGGKSRHIHGVQFKSPLS